jgi:hypothetical protein
MTPQAPRGDEASADAKVQLAIRALEEAAFVYGADTAKGRHIYKVIGAIVKDHGRTEEHAQAITPAEMKSVMMANTPPPPSGPPPGAPGAPGEGPGNLPPGASPGGGPPPPG